MALTWTRDRGWTRERGYNYARAVETWTVRGLSQSPIVNTVAEIEANCPRQIGAVHPDPGLPGAVCREVALVYGPIRGMAKVRAVFDSRVRFSLRNRARTRMDVGRPEITALPIYTAIPGGKYELVSSPSMVQTIARPRIIRIAERLTGTDPDILTAQIIGNVGKGYVFGADPFDVAWVGSSDPVFDGIPYVLAGFTVDPMDTGQNLVRYFFETFGPVRAMPPMTYPNQAIAIPALGFLEKWADIHYPSVGTPFIPVLRPGAFIEEGAALP